MKNCIVVVLAVACGLGGYLITSRLTADPVVRYADRGIGELEDYLRLGIYA